jgi:flagellar biosynthesis/type III secretory pathway protein FliH
VAPVIRSVKLDAAPHRLVHRLAPAAFAKPSSAAPSPVTAAAPAAAVAPVIDPAVQRAWEQRMQAEIAAACAKAEAQGLTEGRAQGETQVRAENQAQHETLSRLLDALGQAAETELAVLEDAAIAIAFEATLKLLGERLATEEGVRAAVHQVLQRVRGQGKALVRLSPGDCAVLTSQPEWASSRFEFKADDTITPGGCFVETPTGRLDGRIETQLAGLAQALIAARRAPAGER